MSLESIKVSLERYKRKLYYKRLGKGVLVTLSLFLGLFLTISSLESLFWFDNSIRLILLILAISSFIVPFYYLIMIPVLELFKLKNGISDKEMAKDIGLYFPEIKDKLTNLLELADINSHGQSLVAASIDQKEKELKLIDFTKAINLKVNLKYLYSLAVVLGILTLLSFVNPSIITDSPERIAKFQEDFERPMPFSIEILNPTLLAYQNEDFTIQIKVEGKTLPERIYLLLDNARKIKLQNTDKELLSYTCVNVQSGFSFQLEAAGYFTKEYEVAIVHRPEIENFRVIVDYPTYTGLVDEVLENIGNARIPEGTTVSWDIKTMSAESAKITLNNEIKELQLIDNEHFKFTSKIKQSTPYTIEISNEYGLNKSPIEYTLDVIPDQPPTIDVNFIKDTVFFSNIILSGKIGDDYGFTRLSLLQKTLPEGKITSQTLTLNKGLQDQAFVYRWSADSTLLKQKTPLELWVTVWDNDGINGPKATSSQKFYFRIPSEDEIANILENNSNKTESQLTKAAKESQKLNKQLEELEDRLKNKKELGWQEEKLIQDIINRKEEIEKSVEELERKHEDLISSQKQFDKQSEKLAEKSKQLQKLMEELLDDKTKAMYDELQKLLEEKSGLDEVNEQLSKIKPGEKNLEKELDRALELFKKLKLETQIEQTADKLENLAERQEQLAQSEESTSDIEKDQESINSEFNEVQKEIDEIEQLNQELDNPQALDDFNSDEEEIDKELEEISESLDNSEKPSKETKSKQQNAGNKMNQMAAKMRQMQSSMEMEAMTENMENLRDILDNLIKTSFEQERIINDFNGVSQSDPRFLELSQDQLTLVANSKVIEDSLLSLAKRVLQISNFVTREIDQINRSLESALSAIKERQKNQATSHQQFAMTSMNNLALLLDDVLQQMQMAMSQSGSGSGSKKGKKKGDTPSMSQMQKQLSQQIQDLKKSGKSGRQLSEELAKMAAEQARIREGLQELQEKLSGENENGEKGGQGLKEAIEKMEQNEVDLVNKRLTDNLIKRQEDIISRMLEAEQSLREQEQSPERKGETANQIKRPFPPAFEDYLKARQAEIELLNTIPLDLNPFYKKEVNDYFRRLSSQEN